MYVRDLNSFVFTEGRYCLVFKFGIVEERRSKHARQVSVSGTQGNKPQQLIPCAVLPCCEDHVLALC